MPFLVHQALAVSLFGPGASYTGADGSGLRDGLPQLLGLGLPWARTTYVLRRLIMPQQS